MVLGVGNNLKDLTLFLCLPVGLWMQPEPFDVEPPAPPPVHDSAVAHVIFFSARTFTSFSAAVIFCRFLPSGLHSIILDPKATYDMQPSKFPLFLA